MYYCQSKHATACTSCKSLCTIGRMVLENGFVQLSKAFRTNFPSVTYHSQSAKHRVLQLPLVSLRVGSPNDGCSEMYLFEYFPGVNYQHFLCLLNEFHSAAHKELQLSKCDLQDILSIAQNDRERMCIQYTACKASGISLTAARKHYGLDNLKPRLQAVEDAIDTIREIKSDIDDICHTQEKAVLQQFGIEGSSDSSSSEESESGDVDGDDDGDDEYSSAGIEEVISILRLSNFNWYELVDQLKSKSLKPVAMYSILPSLSPNEVQLVKLSHAAYCNTQTIELPKEAREAAAWNGNIVSESAESDNPDDYRGLRACNTEKIKAIVKKKIIKIRRKAKRDKVKAIVKERILRRKKSKKVKAIEEKYSDIGTVIEDYVKERSVGADRWRRTGILTFDGNMPIKEKVTYQRIKEHLEMVYQRSFAYGTVIQLCVARNRRHMSASRYKGVAQVTTRRARKGFTLRYNPDNHWSAALYRNLNYVQYSDGSDIVNINRDDAAGFRLDTLSTHRLHRTPIVKGEDIKTTRTDFMNKYPALLQTTSYNFTGTATTNELCAGVVKAAGIFQKNPAQHASDLSMIEKSDEMRAAFINPKNGRPKCIECVRVDGAQDEGPSHLEVQFWWTRRHLERPTLATLVSSRNSGASYLNRVELQNGCLALAHSNLFIPSNLSGSCYDSSTGEIDREKLKTNMDLATDIYISRANNAPCGSTQIHLFRGSDSSENQGLREDVLLYLKGSKKQREKLKSEKFERFCYIDKIWGVRNQHIEPGLPSQYLFFLRCCLSQQCVHPLCQAGTVDIPAWFPGGPPMTVPFPVPDLSRPWEGVDCSKCDGKCYGHFLLPKESIELSKRSIKKPPSQLLKEAFDKTAGSVDSSLKDIAKSTLLPPSEVDMWFEHLDTVKQNRKRGAQKAAATRQKKRQESIADQVYFCEVCHEQFQELTNEIEEWIGCNKCDKWFKCVDIVTAPEYYFCPACIQ